MAYPSHSSHQQSGGFGRRGLANAPAQGARGPSPWGEQRHSLDRATAPSRAAVWDDMAYERGDGRSGAASNLGPAGFWIRVLAYMLDTFFIVLIVAVISVLATEVGQVPFGVAFLVAYVLVPLTYLPLFHSGGWQATPGKRLCGVYVTRADGDPLSFPHAVGRYLALSLSGLTFGVGFLMAAFHGEKKTLHDIFAGTRAVRGRVD